MRWTFTLGLFMVALSGAVCVKAGPEIQPDAKPSKTSAVSQNPFTFDPAPSLYQPRSSVPTLITNVTLLDGLGGKQEGVNLLLADGIIAGLGPTGPMPAGTVTIDGTGKWITPGIIDIHSHAGVFASPIVPENINDVNEATDPNSAHVWAEHSINVQDPSFLDALSAGVTTMQILPGSTDLFGGRSVIVKPVTVTTVQQMKFPGAQQGMKMACGTNPKGNFGEQGRFPSSRMGNVAGMRDAWLKAQAYRDGWAAYSRGEIPVPPARDLKLDTLAAALNGDIKVHIHCYRSDDMASVIAMSHEFGFKIAAFHHAVESYKIAGLLAKEGICSAVWADWWAFKMEAYDGIRENAAFIDAAGACVAMHSDSRRIFTHFTIEAAKAMSYGQRAGLKIAPEHAISWITSAPAKVMGIDSKVGSVTLGKDADIVLWSGDPFNTYTRTEKVFIDGVLLYDRGDPAYQNVSDFELGQPALGGVQ